MTDFDKLQFDFKNISFEQQMLKVQEELGELIKAYKGKEWVIEDEFADCMMSVYGLSKILWIDYKQSLEEGIKKVNWRL